MGGILFPSPKTSYMEANTQKNEETGDSAHEIAPKRPKGAKMPQVCAICPKCTVTLEAHEK